MERLQILDCRLRIGGGIEQRAEGKEDCGLRNAGCGVEMMRFRVRDQAESASISSRQ